MPYDVTFDAHKSNISAQKSVVFTMIITKEHIRFSIYFVFHPKKNVAEASAMICAAYGENVVSHTTCKRWYQKFRQGDFSLEDEPRTGRTQKIEMVELQELHITGYKFCAN